MDENKLKAIIEEAINNAVNPMKQMLADPDTGLAAINKRLDNPDTGLAAINKRLDNPDTGLIAINQKLNDSDTGLAAINNRLDANTEAVVELESTIKGYADSYKANDANIRKVEKRLETVEENAGVSVPPELQLAPQSEF